MFDIIKSYYKHEDFYIIITNNGLLINNFNSIETMEEDIFIIKILNKRYIFKGKNFRILKSIDKSIELNGVIESVEIK